MAEKWRMKNGSKIYPKDMSDLHLVNTVFMILRETEQIKNAFSNSLCLDELFSQTDIPESERIDKISVLSYLCGYREKIYSTIVNQALKRKLIKQNEIQYGEPNQATKEIIMKRVEERMNKNV